MEQNAIIFANGAERNHFRQWSRTQSFSPMEQNAIAKISRTLKKFHDSRATLSDKSAEIKIILTDPLLS
jgi:hypothetical protein